MAVTLELNQLHDRIHADLAKKTTTFDGDTLREISRLFILIIHQSQKQQRSYAYWEKQEVRKLNKNVKALYNDKVQLSIGIVAGVIGVVGGVLGCISFLHAPLNTVAQGFSAGSQGLQGMNTAIHTPKEGEKAYQQTVLQLQQKRMDEAKQNAQSDKQKEEQFLDQIKQAEEKEHNAKASLTQGR